MKSNLPIFGIAKDKLLEFTTLEKDFKRGLSRFPPPHLILPEENVLSVEEVEAAASKLGEVSLKTDETGDD